MELTCPKCQAPMRSYERNGVTVDQCTECRGLFLDRGELEHLVDAEARFHAAPPPAPAAAPAPPAPGHGQHGGQSSYGGQSSFGGYGGKPPKRRKSFLEELFD